jgi:hypothetical protein
VDLAAIHSLETRGKMGLAQRDITDPSVDSALRSVLLYRHFFLWVERFNADCITWWWGYEEMAIVGGDGSRWGCRIWFCGGASGAAG